MAKSDVVLMRWGVVGFCDDCDDEQILLPVDDGGVDYCCTTCDGAVLLLHAAVPVSGRAIAPARRVG